MTVMSPAATDVTPDKKPPGGSGSVVLRGLLRNKLAVLALAVLVLLLLAALFAPLIAPYDPNAQNLLLRLRPPAWQDGGSGAHLLGTDQLGRDMLSRVVHGTRVSLLVAPAPRCSPASSVRSWASPPDTSAAGPTAPSCGSPTSSSPSPRSCWPSPSSASSAPACGS